MFGKRKHQSSTSSRRAARKSIRYLGRPTQKYTKSYTTKEWKKFSPDVQQVLSNRYSVVLTDHSTKSEKIGRVAKSIKKAGVIGSIQKFDKGLTKFDRGMKDFNRGLKVIDETFTKPSKKPKYNLDSLAYF